MTSRTMNAMSNTPRKSGNEENHKKRLQEVVWQSRRCQQRAVDGGLIGRNTATRDIEGKFDYDANFRDRQDNWDMNIIVCWMKEKKRNVS